ncbi:MAG: glycerol-3-phosphate 1-O-acyltransferase PlsY [Clostridia bacterium]|nr:glycerol-3-phosphate 1-O-acyltransferase PlsY [Clostridia bacterium]
MKYEWIRQFGLIAYLGEETAAGGYQIPLIPHILAIILCAAIAYFLGSLNFAIIISKYKFHDDIRNYGSGNGGLTNMMRTYGKKAAAFTLLGDVMKAVVSVLLGMLIAGESGAYLAGFFCVFGHSFPIYYGFKGGKGVLTTAAMVLCLDPLVFLILFILFVCIVAGTRYVSLGSVMCLFIFPLLLNRIYPFTHGGAQPGALVTIVSILIALLVIFLHRSNIKRLWEGNENKFSFKSKGKKPAENNKK